MNAILLVAIIVMLLVVAVVTLARAALRAGRATAGSGRTGRISVAVVASTWIIAALIGAQLVPGYRWRPPMRPRHWPRHPLRPPAESASRRPSTARSRQTRLPGRGPARC